jgi:hypothetical protein
VHDETTTDLLPDRGVGAPKPTPANDAEATLWKLLTTYQKDYGAGFTRTTMDFLGGFSLSFSLLFLWIGGLCLTLLRRPPEDAVLWRRIRLACAVFSGGLLVVSLAYFFLPPIVCVAVVFAAFAVSAMVGRAEDEGGSAGT